MVKMVARGFTAAADAYLTPHILRYLATFTAGFDAGLASVLLLFMQVRRCTGRCFCNACWLCNCTSPMTTCSVKKICGFGLLLFGYAHALLCSI